MKSFVDVVKNYSAWKLQEKGNGKLSKKEIAALREEYRSALAKRSNSSAQLKEAVNKYRAWKKANKGDATLTQKEFNLLKESIVKSAQKPLRESAQQLWEQYVTNYKKFKETKEPGAKITYKELKMLKENFKEAQTKKIRLREADAGFDPAAAGAAAPVPGDPNAMGAAPVGDPNAMPGAAPVQVDPTVAAQIQDVVQSVNALAASAGVQINDLGADPNAGMPPVDGTMQPDPNAAAMGGAPATPPMQEAVKQYQAWKKANKGTDKLTEAEMTALKEQFGPKEKTEYEKIQERIAARQAKLAALQENAAQDYAKAQLGAMGVGIPVSNSHGGDHSVSEEQVKVPSTSQLANGYSSGKAAGETKPAKTWPTKATGKEAGGALQGAGATQTKVKESDEGCEPEEGQEQMQESGVRTVTDLYVDKFFEPKLDFTSIRESMKNGLLG